MRDDSSRAGHEVAWASRVLTVKGPCEVAPHGKGPGQLTVVRRRPAARSRANRASRSPRWRPRERRQGSESRRPGGKGGPG
jgi:hypothetical protein